MSQAPKSDRGTSSERSLEHITVVILSVLGVVFSPSVALSTQTHAHTLTLWPHTLYPTVFFLLSTSGCCHRDYSLNNCNHRNKGCQYSEDGEIRKGMQHFWRRMNSWTSFIAHYLPLMPECLSNTDLMHFKRVISIKTQEGTDINNQQWISENFSKSVHVG